MGAHLSGWEAGCIAGQLFSEKVLLEPVLQTLADRQPVVRTASDCGGIRLGTGDILGKPSVSVRSQSEGTAALSRGRIYMRDGRCGQDSGTG